MTAGQHRPRRRRLRLAALSLLVGSLLLPAAEPGVRAAGWPTYHGDNTRQGNDSSDPGLASAAPAWTSAQLDGALYGQPVVTGSRVIVATENNTVYALDAASGTVEWSTHLGTPRTSGFACGNVRPLGVTGTPVIDAGRVYVAAEIELSPNNFTFNLASLNLADGTRNWMQNVDPPDPQWPAVAQYQQQRGALLLVAGRIMVPLGGLAGDCGTYHGYVTSLSISGTGSVTWWASTETDGHNSGGAVWATGGLSADAVGFVYAPTGNSNHTSSTSAYDYSDGVVKLNPGSLAPGAPVDYFAPSTWYRDNAGDVDLGSTTPLQLPGGRIFMVGKSGAGYLLDAANLGHIGQQQATHQVCHSTNDAAFGSLAYSAGVVYVGCSDGLATVRINPSSTDFVAGWYNTTSVVDHPPTVAGGRVWSITPDSATLIGFDAASGSEVTRFAIGRSTHFTTPTAANGQLYVAAGDRVHAFGSCLGASLLGDNTGGGPADLAAVTSSQTCVRTSTGSAFTAPTVWSMVPFYGSRATLAGDVTGDGRADLIAVNDVGTWVMTSNGSNFSPPHLWSGARFYGTRATLAADLDHDGRADLVAVNDDSVWVMVNTGTGFAAPAQWSSIPFYGTRGTFLADLNADGRADLVAVDDSGTWVMLNTGAGFSAPQRWSQTPFFGDRATTLADLNNDGSADLVAVGSDGTWVMVDTGQGFLPPARWSSVPFYGSLATVAGDVSGDGRADLVSVNGASVWVMTSTGSAFTAPTQWG